jgi:hypothetical protein
MTLSKQDVRSVGKRQSRESRKISLQLVNMTKLRSEQKIGTLMTNSDLVMPEGGPPASIPPGND